MLLFAVFCCPFSFASDAEPGIYDGISNEDGYMFYTDYPPGLVGPGLDDVTVITIIGWRSGDCDEDLVHLKIPKKEEVDSNRDLAIGDEAFAGDEKIYSVEIGEGCISIGSKAFANCPNLHKVYIPDSVTVIADDAFEGSDAVVLYGTPGSMVEDYAITQALPFCDPEDEIYVYVDENGTHITYTVPDLLGKAVITGVKESGTKPIKIHVPSEVPVIGNDAATSTIPVDRIQKEAFKGLNNLSEVIISDGIRAMGTNCFVNCTSLTEVTLPEGLETIPSGTFGGCKSLERIHFPSTVKSLSGSVFGGCTSLKEIDVAESNENFFFDDGILYGGKRGDNNLTLACYTLGREGKEYTVPETVTKIGEYAFIQSELETIILPENLTEIAAWAFGDCHFLTSIHIPSSVQNIGKCAFIECKSLAEVDFGSEIALQEIRQNVFSYCPALHEIKIPETVRTLYECAFMESGLVSIDIPPSVVSIKSAVFLKCKSLHTVNIMKRTEQLNVDVEAFAKTGLKKIFLPARVFMRSDASPFNGSESDVLLLVEMNSTAHTFAEEMDMRYIIVDAEGNQAQTISGKTSFKKVYGSDAFSLGAKAKTELTYSSSDTKVAVVSKSGKVTLKGPGTATITIKAKEEKGYASATKTVTIKSTLKKPSLTATNHRTKKVKLTWDKVPGADGYKVYVCVPGSSKYVCRLTKSARVKSVTHSGLVKGKVYKYKVRAFAKVNGKTIYSAYSTVKKVKIKR